MNECPDSGSIRHAIHQAIRFRRGLPRPEITVLDWNAQPEVGLCGRLRLTFKDAIQGPIILGKTRHIGGGVFSAVDRSSA